MKHELKRKISEAATKRYCINKFFTIQSLADSLKITEDEIFENFSTRRSILYYFYVSRIHIYAEQKEAIEGFTEFTLSEKLSNLFLTLLDQFDEQGDFVKRTYTSYIIKGACKEALFRDELIKELKEIFTSDPNISTACKPLINKYLYQIVVLQFHALIQFWKSDKSRNHENSMALVDKWCSLVEEVCYSKITDKGFDLLKFIAYNSPLNKKLHKCNIPRSK